MSRNVLAVVLVAALVLLAGCSAAPGGGTGTAATDGTSVDGPNTADTGSIDFYISDEPNAIDDFEHLNVTITKVGLHRVGDAPNATATPASTANETATGNATATPSNATDTEGEQDAEGDAEWVEYEVDKTVDLTELVGANATKLDVLEAPTGTYDKVFVYVSEIDATLKNGESVNVKLPSEKLQINKQFAVDGGSNVSFVFDIAVHKAGNSGKYILKPVVSQSGTGDEVEIEDVDEEDEEKEEEQEEQEEDEAEAEEQEEENEAGEGEENETETEAGPGDIEAEFVGPVAAGENATVKVTGPDGPVENATVEANGETVGTTDASGTLTFQVPEDAEELEVTVTKGDAEAELEADLQSGNGNGSLAAAA